MEGAVFTPREGVIHTEWCAGRVHGGSGLGVTVGWWRRVRGVRGQGMMYHGGGITVV